MCFFKDWYAALSCLIFQNLRINLILPMPPKMYREFPNFSESSNIKIMAVDFSFIIIKFPVWFKMFVANMVAGATRLLPKLGLGWLLKFPSLPSEIYISGKCRPPLSPGPVCFSPSMPSVALRSAILAPLHYRPLPHKYL